MLLTREVSARIDFSAGLSGSKLDCARVESVVSQEYDSLMMLYAGCVCFSGIFNWKMYYARICELLRTRWLCVDKETLFVSNGATFSSLISSYFTC